MTRPDPLTRMFDNLDRWRHLPAYQLERRADIFFSLYMRELVEAHCGVAVHALMIPELPLRRDLIWSDKPSRQSVKVDYALFAADRSRVIFVELKTDVGSRREPQDHYLKVAQRVGFRAIVEGICQIALATSSAALPKYGHLLHTLAALECVRLPDGLDALLFPRPQRGVSRLLREIEVLVSLDEFAIEVVYVQPTADAGDGAQVIDFEQVAQHVERHDDALSQLFAEHLRCWTEPAGACFPPGEAGSDDGYA